MSYDMRSSTIVASAQDVTSNQRKVYIDLGTANNVFLYLYCQ